MSRRLVFLLICVLFLSGCVELPETAVSSGEKFQVYQVSDIHFLPDSLIEDKTALAKRLQLGDGKMIHYSEELMDAFAEQVIADNPAALLISGDLTNNGEKAGHEGLAQKLAYIEENSDTRIYVTTGNHDIDNPLASGFTAEGSYFVPSVTAEEFSEIYEDFGFEEAVMRDEASLSYLAAPSEDLFLLMLDTSIYNFNQLLGTSFANGEVREESFEWIRSCFDLAKRKNARIITSTHHSVVNREGTSGRGYTLDNTEEVLSLLDRGDVRLNFSGHIHVQDIRRAPDGQNLFDISTGAFCVHPVQYGVLDFLPSEGFSYRSEFVDVDNWAKAVGQTDSNLLDFARYSQDFFTENQAMKVREDLSDTEIFSPEEVSQLADFVGLLNCSYFGGTLRADKEGFLTSPAWSLWQAAPDDTPWKSYLVRALTDAEEGLPDSVLEISFNGN